MQHVKAWPCKRAPVAHSHLHFSTGKTFNVERIAQGLEVIMM